MSGILKTIGTLLMLGYLSVQGYLVYMTGGFAVGFDEMVYGKRDPFAGRVQVTDNREDKRLKDGYVLLAKHDVLDDDRRATVSLFATVDELLDKGEARPDPDLLEVFLGARAVKLAKAECQLMLQTIARECAVLSASVTSDNATAKYHAFQVRLAFVEKAMLGPLDVEKSWYYGETQAVVQPSGSETSVSPSGARAVRKDIYNKIARVCADMRTRQSPCSVFGISISAWLNEGRSAVKVRGGGEYAFLNLSPA